MPHMSVLPEQLYTAAQLRELDARAIAGGVPAEELMRRAGHGAWQVASTQWPGAKRVLVLCGAGNNAGDGYVVAAHARAEGREVRLLTLGDSARLGPAAAAMRKQYLDAGG